MGCSLNPTPHSSRTILPFPFPSPCRFECCVVSGRKVKINTPPLFLPLEPAKTSFNIHENVSPASWANTLATCSLAVACYSFQSKTPSDVCSVVSAGLVLIHNTALDSHSARKMRRNCCRWPLCSPKYQHSN